MRLILQKCTRIFGNSDFFCFCEWHPSRCASFLRYCSQFYFPNIGLVHHQILFCRNLTRKLVNGSRACFFHNIMKLHSRCLGQVVLGRRIVRNAFHLCWQRCFSQVSHCDGVIQSLKQKLADKQKEVRCWCFNFIEPAHRRLACVAGAGKLRRLEGG